MKKDWWDKGTASPYAPPERPTPAVNIKRWHVIENNHYTWEGKEIVRKKTFVVWYGRKDKAADIVATFDKKAEAEAIRKLLTAVNTEG